MARLGSPKLGWQARGLAGNQNTISEPQAVHPPTRFRIPIELNHQVLQRRQHQLRSRNHLLPLRLLLLALPVAVLQARGEGGGRCLQGWANATAAGGCSPSSNTAHRQKQAGNSTRPKAQAAPKHPAAASLSLCCLPAT